MSLVEDFQMDTSAGLLDVALELHEPVRSHGGRPPEGVGAWRVALRRHAA
jgi:hypothetical protein